MDRPVAAKIWGTRTANRNKRNSRRPDSICSIKDAMRALNFLSSWGKILRGKIPLLSIEITRECPLSCPGCYAYGDSHLGEGSRLADVSDFRGDELVERILDLVTRHDPVQVSLVGG